MDPIPNPVHMVDGKVTVSHITIPPHLIAHVFSLFENQDALSHSATAFTDVIKDAPVRQSIECKTRDEYTRKLYMMLDEFVLTSLFQWKSDVYAGVAREQLMLYENGAGSRLHLDDQHNVPDKIGKTKYLMHLLNQVAGLLYISTPDVQGGDFILPEQNIIVPPVTGTLVCFPSNYLHPHLVTPVTAGKRISIARHYYVRDLPGV